VQEHFAARCPVDRTDGARIRFPHGWGLVRASNTQPALVLRFEADSPEHLAAVRKEVEDLVLALPERISSRHQPEN
jgi:phosphomannomutase/phosphoglucomutase